jgi:hypothetical protein
MVARLGRDSAQTVDQKSGNGCVIARRGLYTKVDKVMERKRSWQHDGSVTVYSGAEDVGIGFVINFPDELLDEILNRDDALGPAELVANDGKLLVSHLETP